MSSYSQNLAAWAKSLCGRLMTALLQEIYRLSKIAHVSIMPRVTMALERDEAALAKTQKYWGKVETLLGSV